MMKIILIFCIPFLAFSQLTPCEEEVANATGSLGEFIPECEEDGSYSPIQCWASTGYCWCVDSNGIEIPGTAIAVWEGYPNCNQQIDSLNVLFIGNSYTSANNLPNIVADIANSAGDFLYTESNTIGGATLQSHFNNTNSNNLIMSGNWDYVVLQEQSQYPSFPMWQVEQDVFPYASGLNELILEYNDCAKTVFFMTWGRENGDQINCENWPPVCTYEGMDDLLQERYIMMGNDNNAAISPVGAVWRYIRETNDDGKYNIDLYNSDGSHPSSIGSYVAGVCFYTTLFQKDPTEIPWNGNEQWNISSTDAEFIKEVVKLVVYDNLDNWNISSNDIDDDAICNNVDNCPEIYNPNQSDLDNNGIGDACDNEINPCELLPDVGECDGAFQIFYFNQNTSECEESIWGGCNGIVPFFTLEECQNSCETNTILNEEKYTKNLLKTIDILGREAIDNPFKIHIYDDGSVEKKYY
ncbi:MAG: hypothetical protein CMP50_00390 [Flavobacteriales bacterium]|nr:hypothetical protein [Flavobacteriales bacterium]